MKKIILRLVLYAVLIIIRLIHGDFYTFPVWYGCAVLVLLIDFIIYMISVIKHSTDCVI